MTQQNASNNEITLGTSTYWLPSYHIRKRKTNTHSLRSIEIVIHLPSNQPVKRQDPKKLADYLILTADPICPGSAFGTGDEYFQWLVKNRHIKNEIEKAEIAGLSRCIHQIPHPAGSSYMVGHHDNGERLILRCDEEPRVANPLCVVKYTIPEECELHYFYSKQYLPEWKRVDRLVRKTLDSYKIK